MAGAEHLGTLVLHRNRTPLGLADRRTVERGNPEALRDLRERRRRILVAAPETLEVQRSGATDFQQRGQGQGEVEGEGSYTATRDYQKNIKQYLDKADVQADAEAAKKKLEEAGAKVELK